ncbi:MAG: hypothetical protein AAGA21_22000 [Pseudomonadota bacterium]
MLTGVAGYASRNVYRPLPNHLVIDEASLAAEIERMQSENYQQTDAQEPEFTQEGDADEALVLVNSDEIKRVWWSEFYFPFCRTKGCCARNDNPKDAALCGIKMTIRKANEYRDNDKDYWRNNSPSDGKDFDPAEFKGGLTAAWSEHLDRHPELMTKFERARQQIERNLGNSSAHELSCADLSR